VRFGLASARGDSTHEGGILSETAGRSCRTARACRRPVYGIHHGHPCTRRVSRGRRRRVGTAVGGGAHQQGAREVIVDLCPAVRHRESAWCEPHNVEGTPLATHPPRSHASREEQGQRRSCLAEPRESQCKAATFRELVEPGPHEEHCRDNGQIASRAHEGFECSEYRRRPLPRAPPPTHMPREVVAPWHLVVRFPAKVAPSKMNAITSKQPGSVNRSPRSTRAQQTRLAPWISRLMTRDSPLYWDCTAHCSPNSVLCRRFSSDTRASLPVLRGRLRNP